MVKHNEAIINAVLPLLLPAIANRNATQRQVTLAIAQRDDESVRPMVYSIDNQLGPDHTGVGGLGCSSYPEFHRFFARGVQDNFL